MNIRTYIGRCRTWMLTQCQMQVSFLWELGRACGMSVLFTLPTSHTSFLSSCLHPPPKGAPSHLPSPGRGWRWEKFTASWSVHIYWLLNTPVQLLAYNCQCTGCRISLMLTFTYCSPFNLPNTHLCWCLQSGLTILFISSMCNNLKINK